MPIYQERSNRKPSSGRLKDYRKTKQYSHGSQPTMTRIGTVKSDSTRVLGGSTKFRLRSAQFINVVDPSTNKTQKVEITTVVDNTANKNYVRRNILTKGTIVETSAGKVRITSRPGQTNTLSGVLVA